METTSVFTLVADDSIASTESSWMKTICSSLLRDAQNADGGWGFRPNTQSRVEPTCWALHTLLYCSGSESSEGVTRGFRFLRGAQLPDGSWPSAPEAKIGCWVTSLACWVLLAEKDSSDAVAAGLSWFCGDWPLDSAPWARLLRRLSSQRHFFPQNGSLRGWGWTPRTSSWVEPTSFALLALQMSPKELLPRVAKRRQQLAENLLLDRMCPGGGWNCGNPLVYGVAGEPLVIPTAWALLALRNHPDRPENRKSLEWLERNIAEIQGPGSLALARICLECYGRSLPASTPDLRDFYRKNEFLRSTQVAAWVCLALSGGKDWLTPPARIVS